ncbi:DUF4405 domain-containing protein [Carboxylicivirga sp. A043]|nr:DUF4405 domain-containing protein [Carboxylicivirga sp. A043]
MNKMLINIGLLVFLIFTIVSGLLIQIKYHIGMHSENIMDKSVISFDYYDWSCFHKISIVPLFVLIVFHISLNWKWFRTVISKRLFNKNRQVITLTLIFVLVAITGFVPWIIDLAEGNEMTRKRLIEFHDKIAIILSIYFILHIMKRLKWYLTSIEKMSKNTATRGRNA